MSLYECQDCKKLVPDATAHAIETKHTNFKTVTLSIAGGEGQAPPSSPTLGQANRIAQQAPPSPESSLSSRLASVAKPLPVPTDFKCPECGRIMMQGAFPEQVECEEHGAYTKEMAKELWDYQHGKPKAEYAGEGRKWFGLPSHLGKRQIVGFIMIAIPGIILAIEFFSMLLFGRLWLP